MSDIKFDFNAAKKQEECLEDIAYHFNHMIVNRYDPCMVELGQVWQGNESKLFQDKMILQREKLKHTAKLIEVAKQAMHEASARMYHAEENVKEIAVIRTYK